MPGNQRFKTMSLQMLKHASKSVSPTIVCVFFTSLAVWGQSPLAGDKSSYTQQSASSSAHRLVVLLDINPHQKTVLPVELALAEGIIQRVHQPENTFSVITFASQTPTLLKPGDTADEAIAIIRDVTLEQTRQKYFFVHFYDALSLAMSAVHRQYSFQLASRHFGGQRLFSPQDVQRDGR
jgi:hypothetical protein